MGAANYDYIVVGAGSSGCVLANRLSGSAGGTVLLLEAGGPAKSIRLKIPAAGMTMADNPKASWTYLSEPEPGLGGRRLPIPRGKVMGGSSAINGAVYNRGHPLDFVRWAALGLPEWDFAAILPYFLRLEDHWRGADELHGGGGPIPVNKIAVPNPISALALEAARSLGYPLSDDWLGAEPEGWGLPECNVDSRGRRITSARAFLDPIRNRESLTIHANAQAHRILFLGDRAIGVEYRRNGRVETAYADREVILAAGAINSPHLLLLSGVGPKAELAEVGIESLHDLPGVGRDFNDQPAIFSIARSNALNSFNKTLRIDQLALTVGKWALGFKTELHAPPCIAAANVRTVQGRDVPDLRFMLSAASLNSKPWFPWIAPGAGSQILAMAAVGHPKSRGSIRLASNDPRQPPRVLYNLLTDPWDMDEARRGFRLLLEVLAQAPLSSAIEGFIAPPKNLTTDDEVDSYVRLAAGTTQHCMGSCRMGIDDDAVVDQHCRVKGLQGLRVVDLSVFPVQLSGNPHGAAMALADKVSDFILGVTPLASSNVGAELVARNAH